jgi:DNA-binding CsgD family transcriptional regulator
MPHLAVALYFLALSSELVSFGVFVSILRGGHSPLVRSYLVYLLSASFQTLASLVGLYASIALGLNGPQVAGAFYFVTTLSLALQTYAAPRFFLGFADLPFAGATKRCAIGGAAFVLVSAPLAFASGGLRLLSFLPPTLALLSFLAMMLYSQARLVGAYERIKDRIGRIGVPAIIAYNLACVAAGVAESLVSGRQLAEGRWPSGLLLQPSIAIAWNLLSLAWAFAFEASGAVSRASGIEPDEARARQFGMTDRELELARLLASGAANKEMADLLGLSANTVRNHVHNIYEKTGARNRVELVRTLCGADG